MSTFALLTCSDSIGAGNPGPSAHPSWVASTAYTAVVPGAASSAAALTSFVVNGGNYYACIQSGTSAGSGGPSGTGLSITDGTCKWAFIGGTAGLNVPNWFTWVVSMALASGKSVTCLNDAVSGTTSINWAGTTGSQGAWWFTSQPHIDDRTGNVLVGISIATNDCAAITVPPGSETLTGQQVAANAIGIALQVAAGGGTPFLTSCMSTSNIANTGETARLAYNAAVQAFCRARGYPFIDFATVAGVTKIDGTHPDAAGHAALANAAWAVLSGKFK